MDVAYIARKYRNIAMNALPERYARPLVAEIPEPIRNACDAYIRDFTSAAIAGRGMMFLGRARTWKTTAACYVAVKLHERHALPTTFVSFPEVMLGIELNRFSDDTRNSLYTWQSCPMLLLDDFATATLGTFAQTVLHGVLSHRFNTCLPTLLTGNVQVTKDTLGPTLTDQFGPLLARRLIDASYGYTVLCS